ncbi:aminotransferase class I/II-fold pyridoxal phosphate-dependent enzyme [Ancylomarina euxinus]|uniref:Aminotransferase class I/II-fold pyridoxal phosphate-dependent enzyme n=1 Tax=Ancylomarina euxinus TaxID=2283627 RepID=A0A425XXP0_9BACT|nr:aminotransferase class I/II-fold pyridoxal phosphate-dependent enzyme [Ancylomarina euxinus]MCZ4694755.1 aminotransferase class I/II-fold pyridoxal phosphate-dependent enzyme [Ancylomarina euxinus]MUP16419.1 aminotransferase class I/II-fold pyridoxal phosphate-dependent enzyme [Ancylomarina euxinus]RRG19446.1 aminotransferase class I/II-fold pyridoxal phosphate-dependent enzyme [Ancylomarina euxinus]
MKDLKSADHIQDLQFFGEFGGVNPSICDSSTFTFLQAKTMADVFDGKIEGCYLYSRHWNPSNLYLSKALAQLEGTESALVTASGMAAISSTLLQLCSAGDEIVSSRTIYGGSYALMKNFLPKLGINTKFVDTTDTQQVRKAISKQTRLIYCETMSNPMLEITDIRELTKLAKANNCLLVVDNTFSPLIFSPAEMGADIVIHSLTKFINGMSDCVAGAICGSQEFINSLYDVNSGSAMLLGPVLDSHRSASILKNMKTLHIRMQQHARNALSLAKKLQADGYRIIYPGLDNHPQYTLLKEIAHTKYGAGALMVIDLKEKERANRFMELMQEANIGYLAVSLGSYKTLFSAPGGSTSSEIPEHERMQMGLTDGLVRISIGLDDDIERTYEKISQCLDIVHPKSKNK